MGTKRTPEAQKIITNITNRGLFLIRLILVVNSKARPSTFFFTSLILSRTSYSLEVF